MTDLRKAAQQALEALEGELLKMLDKPVDEQYRVRYAYLLRVITALREALAQPEQEPDRRALQAAGTHPAPCARHCEAKAFEIEIRSLKSRLKQAQPVQPEPLEYWNAVEGWVKIDEVREHFDAVGCGTIYKDGGEGRVPLYTTLPQRPWVGLTEEDRCKFAAAQYGWEDLCLAVEAKLKEKNHG